MAELLRGLVITRHAGQAVTLSIGGEVVARIQPDKRCRLLIDAAASVDVSRSDAKKQPAAPRVDRATFGGAA